ncbi:hypothetical protein WMY93_003412 [Mugilogobius chulae]|uniref:Uncharacterized protein n=1 Tax=Mugilogobius chulae TaxID=88201 RepID=A0AAW0QBK3_9GOBI
MHVSEAPGYARVSYEDVVERGSISVSLCMAYVRMVMVWRETGYGQGKCCDARRARGRVELACAQISQAQRTA